MARLQTRDEIVELIRVQYDLESLSASTNPSLSAVQSMLNESLQSLYAMQMECYGDDYFTESFTLTTTPDVATSSLPADFHKLLSVNWRKEPGCTIPIPVADVRELARSTLESQTWVRPRYRLTASAIQWSPVPSEAYTVDLWYSAIPADLTAGADVVNVGPGWVQWVIHDVCLKIARRLRDQDAQGMFGQLRADAEKRLREQAPGRSESEAQGIRRARDGYYDADDEIELRTVGVSGSGGAGSGVTDHGALSGLADNDHPQYLLANGGNPQVTSVVYAEVTAAAAVNWALGARQRITLAANTTFTFSAPAAGVTTQLKITQDGTGSRTATWPAAVKWAGGTPTLTTTAGATDIATFVYDGTSYWGVLSKNFT